MQNNVPLESQLLAMLQFAAAVPWPLRFRLRREDGTESEVELNSSFVLIGRSEDCDIHIPLPTVSQRHVYLQAIGTQVACVDLLSTGGIHVEGAPFRGWLTSAHTLIIGKTQLQLVDDHWTADETLANPLDFRPRDEQRPEYGLLPLVELELLNTSQHGKKWPINRVITLVGRDDRCRITVMDERLSRVQCGLLLLPTGLWAIDLVGSGGIQINGQPCRCGLLATGAELSFGPYKVRAHYPEIEAQLLQTNIAAQTREADFLTRSNRVLKTEFYHDTVIVMPTGDTQSCLYQDLHIEASRINDMILKQSVRHVLIDFSRASNLGHVVLEALMSICRVAPGRCALCSAGPDVSGSLQLSALNRRYQLYSNRVDALQAIYLPS